MDQERIQFVADIITPLNDPGFIYVLSSRFQKYALKNLDQNDLNVRIMRMRDLTKETYALATPSRPLITPAPATTTATSPIPNFGGGGSTSYSQFNSPHSNAGPFTFHHQLPTFTTKSPSPYQFEPVGVVNKEIRNPFLFLNSGERPSFFNNDIKRNFDFPAPPSTSGSYYLPSHG